MPIQPQRNVMAQFQARPADIQFSQFGVPIPSLTGMDTTGGLPTLTPPQLSPSELGNFFGGGAFGGNENRENRFGTTLVTGLFGQSLDRPLPITF